MARLRKIETTPAAPAVPAIPPSPAPRRRRRRIIIVLVAAAVLVLAAFVPLPVHASMFGEENTTLASMLIQLLRVNAEMKQLNDAADGIGDTVGGLMQSYQRVNAGVDELRHYNFESFAGDLK